MSALLFSTGGRRIGAVATSVVILAIVVVMSSSLRAIRVVSARAVVVMMVAAASVMSTGVLDMLLLMVVMMHEGVVLGVRVRENGRAAVESELRKVGRTRKRTVLATRSNGGGRGADGHTHAHTRAETMSLRLSEQSLDTLNVRVGAQAGQMRLDARRNHVPLLGCLGLRDLKGSLHNVVTEGMLQEADEGILVGRLREQGTRGIGLELSEFAGHHLHGSGITNLDTLLNNVRAELLRREEVEVAQKVGSERFANSLQTQVEHVLHNVVTELILNQAQSIVSDLSNQLHLLLVRRMINAALHDAATVTVSGDLHAVVRDSIVDELVIVRLKTVDALLDDVVSVEVLDERHDGSLEGLANQTNLLGRAELLNSLLNGTSSMHVLRDLNQRSTNSTDNRQALGRGALLDQLLAEVVSKRIRHELDHLRHDLGEDQVAGSGCLVLVELLLQVTATVLILAHLEDLANALFKGSVRVAHGCKRRVPIGRSTSRAVRASRRAHSAVGRSVGDSSGAAQSNAALRQRRHMLRVVQAVRVLLRGEAVVSHVGASVHVVEKRLVHLRGMHHRGGLLMVHSRSARVGVLRTKGDDLSGSTGRATRTAVGGRTAVRARSASLRVVNVSITALVTLSAKTKRVVVADGAIRRTTRR